MLISWYKYQFQKYPENLYQLLTHNNNNQNF